MNVDVGYTLPSEEKRMQAKITLITGGSRGLGRSAALHIAERGGDVIITYRKQQADADAVVSAVRNMGRTAVALQLDVAQNTTFGKFAIDIKATLAQHWQRTQFDHLLNNAGQGVHTPLAETTEAQFDQLVNEHLKAPLFLTQALLPLIADGGRVLNVSTGLTRFVLPGYGAYAAMKGAVEVLSKYWAKELGARGIAVNTLAPGAIETDFGGGVVRDNAGVNQFIASQTALGRVGKPDDIGRVIAALLSDDAGWVNGQRIEASGGMFL
jgi:NAD(P)-dependent dehydrogenase (short-subunit alcohol dehydrogenase family)